MSRLVINGYPCLNGYGIKSGKTTLGCYLGGIIRYLLTGVMDSATQDFYGVVRVPCILNG
jgi:hypothetical protein